jgi:hypothetical protein
LGPTATQIETYLAATSVWYTTVKPILESTSVSDDELWSQKAERGLSVQTSVYDRNHDPLVIGKRGSDGNPEDPPMEHGIP